MRPRDWGEMLTDELRECIATAVWQYEDDVKTAYIPKDKLTAIADRIDERHERALRESYDEGYASADDWLAQHEDAMAEHGWIRLPLDADGVPIRVGDVLDGYGKTIEVVCLRHERSEWVLISRDGNGYANTFAFAHHHAPTVEDVLREFVQEMYEHIGMYEADDIDANEWRDADNKTIAEYAAKLRLAEEVDE